MAKNPAFLFYSKDFYEGTRTMLPSERAAYIDLMIYQHQHGLINLPANRLTLYCVGVSEQDITNVLSTKFVEVDGGWINVKLQSVLDDRKEYVQKQSINGTVGQFWKKSKALLNKKDFNRLQALFTSYNNRDLAFIIKEYESKPCADYKAMLVAMLQAMPKHLENANEDEDVNKNITVNCGLWVLSDNFMPIIIEWLKYRTEIKKPYTSSTSVLKFCQKLDKLSERNSEIAQKIVDQSIANGWQGIFALNDYNHGDRIDPRKNIPQDFSGYETTIKI